jgi:hypothetical protein
MIKLVTTQDDGFAIDITGAYEKSSNFHIFGWVDVLYLLSYAFFNFKARQSSLSALSMIV